MTAKIQQVNNPDQHRPQRGGMQGVCLFVSLLTLWLGQVPAAVAADWFFTLRPGETATQLALRCCGDAKFGDQILAYNRLDMRYPPVVGSRLKVPVNWLQTQPADAEILYVRGPVSDGSGRPLAAGDKVAMGTKVATGNQGWAIIRFADQSTLQLDQQTEVVFDLLSAHGDSGMVDTLVRFSFGRGELRVTPSTTNRFRVATPTGIAAVRGTQFRIGAAKSSRGNDDKALLETTEGEVSLASGSVAGGGVIVEAGYGAVADSNGVTKETLLAAPSALLVPATPGTTLRATWAKIPGAQQYAVQLHQVTAAGTRPLDSRLQQAAKVRFDNLSPGQYQLQVRGIAASGLQGLDAVAQAQLEAAPPAANRWWPFSLLVIPLLFL